MFFNFYVFRKGLAREEAVERFDIPHSTAKKSPSENPAPSAANKFVTSLPYDGEGCMKRAKR